MDRASGGSGTTLPLYNLHCTPLLDLGQWHLWVMPELSTLNQMVLLPWYPSLLPQYLLPNPWTRTRSAPPEGMGVTRDTPISQYSFRTLRMQAMIMVNRGSPRGMSMLSDPAPARLLAKYASEKDWISPLRLASTGSGGWSA